MTPPDHLLTGLSIGTVYASVFGMFSLKRLKYIPVILLCGVFAMFPDADSFRGIYSSTDPFTGHRGITHSLFFVILISAIFTVLYAVYLRIIVYYKGSVEKRYLWTDLFILSAFSGFSHLIMDLPQPPGVWKGIPVFFPLENAGLFVRSGGWGKIGWYDYRITWILLVSVTLSFVFLSAAVFFESRAAVKRIFSVCILITVITAGVLVTDHIRHSTFKGSREWNESQRRYIEGFPSYVKSFTVSGRAFILRFIK